MYGPFLTRSRNVDTAWRSMVDTIIENGASVYTERKKQRTLECICGIAQLTDWRTGSITPRNYIGLTPQVIEQHYWPQYSTAEKGEHTYTYGWCMRKRFGFSQIQHVIDTLKKGSDFAFAQFWNPTADPLSSDPPCINIVGFHRVKGRINLVEYIRSNDIARAWPEDVSGSYAVFLTEVSAHFGGASARGSILTVSGSAHVYETALEEIGERFRSSYPSASQKPAERTSITLGPVLREVRGTEKCSNVIKKIVDDYSRILDEESLYVCLKLRPTDRQSQTLSSSSLENILGAKLSTALMRFEGRNEKGEMGVFDQISWASAKVNSAPESRRNVVTPNNPWIHEYSLNPLIIQFLVREGIVYTVALYQNASIDNIDEHSEALQAISNEVRRTTKDLKPGPIVMILTPVKF